LCLGSGKIFVSVDGAFCFRALFPTSRSGTVEFYQVEIGPKKTEIGEPHPPGTIENIVVNQGNVCITVQDEIHLLHAGDAIHFRADAPHVYENVGDSPALLYLVISYGNADARPSYVPVAK
jgi:quercetin dioxygenase-like cupin family protein